jgi:hypothetical protein
LNNIVGVISLFITLPGIGLPQKNYGAIGAAWVYLCCSILNYVDLFIC